MWMQKLPFSIMQLYGNVNLLGKSSWSFTSQCKSSKCQLTSIFMMTEIEQIVEIEPIQNPENNDDSRLNKFDVRGVSDDLEADLLCLQNNAIAIVIYYMTFQGLVLAAISTTLHFHVPTGGSSSFFTIVAAVIHVPVFCYIGVKYNITVGERDRLLLDHNRGSDTSTLLTQSPSAPPQTALRKL